MECNVGGLDRGARTAALVALLGIGLSSRLSPGWRTATFLLALVQGFTVATRYCPLNHVVGLNTCSGEMGPSRSLADQSTPSSGDYLGEGRPEHYAG